METGQVLLSREAERRFVPASITKVMSAYLAFELMADGELAPTDRFTMSAEAHEAWHRRGSTMFMAEGDEASVDDLLRGITGISANDASAVLAEGAAGSVEAWVEAMNAKARDLGLRDTHFGTPNGWPDGGRTFTTARDLERLARALIARHPDRFARYFGQEGFAYNGVAQANRDPISGQVAGADGLKTGYTRQAGNGFLGTAKRDGRRLLMVVAAVDDYDVRGQAARELMEWGFSAFEARPAFSAGDIVGSARVQRGSSDTVALRATRDAMVSIPRGGTADIAMAVRYEGPLQAPVIAGERVAVLRVRVGDAPVFDLPLEAAQDVPSAGPWRRLVQGLQGLVS